MIGAWSEIVFGSKSLGTSALDAGFVAAAARVDRKAAATGLPPVAWLSAATLLATQI